MKLYFLLSLGLTLMGGTAHAQSSCSQAVTQARNNCTAALGQANGVGGAGGTNSISGSASNISQTAALQSASLSSSMDYCQDQLKECQSTCKGNGSNPSSPNSGLPACTAGQVTMSTGAGGIPIKTVNPGQNCNPSPLVVQLPPAGAKPEPLALTSQIAGVLFDILGLNSFPLPFTKKQISWLTPTSRTTNYFLVLPNPNNEVSGIDQLFGNNTLGPDGTFAANGFLALAKWDGRRADGSYDVDAKDKRIDAKDEVFTHLRLWADLNGDGIAQPDELHTLEQLDVKSIDLDYDPNFVETDSYGNQIRTKSVVTTADGSLHLIFDIWFNLAVN